MSIWERQADLLGPTEYSGETPQKEEDWNNNRPMTDQFRQFREPQDDTDYQFVFANGQLHVSPWHTHDDLLTHAGANPTSNGPVAVGYAQVNKGHVLWAVTSNMSIRGVRDILKDYSDTVGWQFEGVTDAAGNYLDDIFDTKKSMWYKMADTHMIMAERPMPDSKLVRIEGKTAIAFPYTPEERDALREWAEDFGYKLAEFPGGGNMVDKIKVFPRDDLYNRGLDDFQPEKNDLDLDLHGNLECSTCGQKFDRSNELLLHRKTEHEQEFSDRLEDGKFPWRPNPTDDTGAGFGTIPVPNSGETIACVAALLPIEGDDGLRYYGAYAEGLLVGFAAERHGKLVEAVDDLPEAGVALCNLIQLHEGSVEADANSILSPRLAHRFAAKSKGKDPKDQIDDAIPFVYDVAKKSKIHIGYEGEKTHQIPGDFTPGGIIEGYYEPGGKLIITTTTRLPWTIYSLVKKWYDQFPHMEITKAEVEKPGDKKTKKSHWKWINPQPPGPTVRGPASGTDPNWEWVPEDEWGPQGGDYEQEQREMSEPGQSLGRKMTSTEVGSYIRAMVAADPEASAVYDALKQAGGKVYVVGGKVRDALMGRHSDDFDMMVAGLDPKVVMKTLKKLPGRVDETGLRFGVFRYKLDPHSSEDVQISIPRTDQYETGRRGEGQITVDPNLPIEHDLQRRDFTVNSMAVDLDNGQLIDPYGGANDIEQNVLRTTHPNSFGEDPSRLVRALMAHGRFGLDPDERTRHEMVTNGHMLQGESPDTLHKVLDKWFSSENPAKGVRLAHDTGLLEHLLPEVEQHWDFDQNNPHHNLPLGEHLHNVLENVSRMTKDPDVRLAAIMHDIGKPASAWTNPETGKNHYYRGPHGEGDNHEEVGARMAEGRLKALRHPNVRTKRIKHLIEQHMFPAFNSPKGARKFIQRVGDEHADDLLNLRQADQSGKGMGPEYFSARTSVDTQRKLVNEARQTKAPTSMSGLAINGNDLMQAGVPQGPQIGQILNNLLNHTIEHPEDNSREKLLQMALH